jgi:hypothetical protein
MVLKAKITSTRHVKNRGWSSFFENVTKDTTKIEQKRNAHNFFILAIYKRLFNNFQQQLSTTTSSFLIQPLRSKLTNQHQTYSSKMMMTNMNMNMILSLLVHLGWFICCLTKMSWYSIVLVYHTVHDIFFFIKEFIFFIKKHHLKIISAFGKIISLYMTVFQIILRPLWNITCFLIKKMMMNAVYASAAAADGSGSGSSIPDLTPANSPPSCPERCRRRRRPASAATPAAQQQESSSTAEYPRPSHNDDDWFDRNKFLVRQQKKQSKDERRNAYYNEEEKEDIDLDKFVTNYLKKKSKQQQPPQQPRSQRSQPEVETIIVETVVEDEYYEYNMCKDKDEAQNKQIDLFDNFHDKDAIWNYIETVW